MPYSFERRITSSTSSFDSPFRRIFLVEQVADARRCAQRSSMNANFDSDAANLPS